MKRGIKKILRMLGKLLLFWRNKKEINGKIYLFSRLESIKRREKFELTPENIIHFKEIKQITWYKDNILTTLDFSGYFISEEDATIITYNSSKNQAEVLQCNIIDGYYHARLSKNGNCYSFKLSRLVLIAHHKYPFIIYKGKQVYYWDTVADHINEDKLNDSYSNLQWLPQKENVIKSITCKAIKLSRNDMSIVLPSAESLATFCSSDVNHIRDAAYNKLKFFENDIEYITDEEYQDKKIFNTSILLFKQRTYTVEKYSDKNIFIKKYNSVDDATGDEGCLSSNFSKKLGKSVSSLYIHNYKGKNIVTPFQYKEMIFRGFIWKVICGTIITIEKEDLQQICS